MVIVVAVMPGADAVRAALELLLAAGLTGLELAPMLLLVAGLLALVELELELHAATVSAATAAAATAGT
jgi:hypothetical protein